MVIGAQIEDVRVATVEHGVRGADLVRGSGGHRVVVVPHLNSGLCDRQILRIKT